MTETKDIINKYKLKDGITMPEITKELSDKGISNAKGGSWVNEKSSLVFWHVLADSIEVEVALPENLSEWNDFDFVLVMDNDFGQPYTPFYKGHLCIGLLNIIGNYNKFMDSLSFLERQ